MKRISSRTVFLFAVAVIATALLVPWFPATASGNKALAEPAAEAANDRDGDQQAAKATSWPELTAQLSQRYDGQTVDPGSALAQLIRENQDFGMLRVAEMNDQRGLPPWLRVWWRKHHPEQSYPAADPTGGYPLVLKEILEWMATHQDLKPGPGVDGDKDEDGDRGNTIDSNVGANTRISGLQSAARSESDVRIDYFDTTKIISASNNITGGGHQGVYFSSDSGATWGQTTLPFTGTDTSHSDPTVDWTNDGRAWSSTLGIVGGTLRFRNYFSTDNGATWTFEATPSGAQTNVDKQMVWVDKSASSPFFGQMYGIWHNGTPAFMNRRTAGAGGTWIAAPIQVSGAESTGTSIGGDVKTNSAGDVFGFWPTTGNRKVLVIKSTDGGNTFGTPVQIATTFDSFDIGIPSMASRRAFMYVSGGAYKAGAINNVYATWTDQSGDVGCQAAANEPGSNVASTCKTRIWFSRSTDGGATWSPATKVNNQAGLNDQLNQWFAVDETNGSLALMYYDTVGDPGRKKTDIWYQFSADAGVTWSQPQKVTTAQTDETAAGADSGNQYGDYNGMSAYAGVVIPVWTDRRNAAHEEIFIARITNPTAAGSTIAGRIATADGSPIDGVTMTLAGTTSGRTITDANGQFSFSNAEAGGFYSVTPSRANYSFTPAQRSFSLLGNMTDAGFTAVADATPTANAIDTTEYFVRQQYLDFLGREPDQGGLEFWSEQINQCNQDAACIRQKRIDVSAAFFMSGEFQETGSYVYDMYAGLLGRTPGYNEFAPDRAAVVGGAGLDQAKTAFAGEFVQRSEFIARYPQGLSREQFVDAVLQTMQQRSGTDLSTLRNGLLADYDNGGRPIVVRHAVESGMFVSAEYNRAFVLMEYFGYLRRGVDQGGYDFWLNVLNQGSRNNYHGMVCAFVTATEYQRRFSSVVTHSNAECGP